ncbi:ion channel [Marinoscillum sp.]|uniref:ion channel n=1 Tax=Marinoscillum sp. TaxID=2024838 RepID=UPI003BAC8352
MARNKRTNNLSERFRELGLGTKRLSTDRFISKDGQFNVINRGAGLSGFSLYHWLINMSWSRFFVFVTLSYFLVNTLFGTIYYLIGIEYLTEYNDNSLNEFTHCFFFSTQTLTTVGYGRISPVGPLTSFVAAVEAMIGLLGFAFATGILYGRFSKARSKIAFSEKILISPYRGAKGLKFRIANMRESQLIDMEARVMYSFLQKDGEDVKRRYMSLDLEINFINMFPLPWTIVHPIDENSPIFGKGMLDLSDERAEFLIILKGYDDTFNTYVHQIHEYNMDELVFDADFDPMFDPAAQGETVVHLNKISDFHKV